MSQTFDDWYEKIFPKLVTLTNNESARVIGIIMLQAYLLGLKEATNDPNPAK